MFPLGHLGTGLIIGTILYAPIGAFILGVFLPDIVDKPLSILGLVECSRWYAHTVLFAFVAGAAAFLLTRRKSIAVAILLGSLVHLVGDAMGFVPYLMPFVHYDPSVCVGDINYIPSLELIALEVVGAVLVLVWWKHRSKLFYLRERILKTRKLENVFKDSERKIRKPRKGNKRKARRLQKGIQRKR